MRIPRIRRSNNPSKSAKYKRGGGGGGGGGRRSRCDLTRGEFNQMLPHIYIYHVSIFIPPHTNNYYCIISCGGLNLHSQGGGGGLYLYR